MALQLRLPPESTTLGIPVAEAYVRIEHMEFDEHSFVGFSLSYYYNEVTRLSGDTPILRESLTMRGFNHTVPVSPKRQIYEYLKTLPKFVKAVNV